MDEIKRMKQTRWQKWIEKDSDIQLYQAFLGDSFEKMTTEYLMRLADAGFGKRYRKRARFQVAVAKAYAAATKAKNPSFMPEALFARILINKHGPRKAPARFREIVLATEQAEADSKLMNR
jgi:hypothetical protein